MIFARDVFVVVCGVAFTFWATSIAERSKIESDLKVSIALVKSELEINKHSLIETRKVISGNQCGYQFIKDNLHNINTLPDDTLKSYLSLSLKWLIYPIHKTAFDLLKGSVKNEYIDPMLLIKLTQTYESCLSADTESLNYYNDSRLMLKHVFAHASDMERPSNKECLMILRDDEIFRNRCANLSTSGMVIDCIDLALEYIDTIQPILENLESKDSYMYIKELHDY